MTSLTISSSSRKEKQTIRGLVAGPVDDAVFHWMLEDLKDHQRPFARMGLHLTYANCPTFRSIQDTYQSFRPDILFVAFPWNANATECVDFLKPIYNSADRPRIVYLDTYDQSTSPHLQVLPYVDKYWKKQTLTPISLYNTNQWAGKNPLADMAVRYGQAELNGWSFGSSIPDEYRHRLEVSWNIGVWKRVSRQCRHPWLDHAKRLFQPRKSIDIFCRVSTKPSSDADPNNIYTNHRERCLMALSPLQKKYTVASNLDGSRVSLKEFNRQLRASRIALSPWGWGEITDRDFRVINNRTLLIKPDMSHVQTSPNVYIPHETYVPVKWDLSDLEEQCDYYLSRPKEIKRITDNASFAYRSFFANKVVEQKMKNLLESLGLKPVQN